MSAHHDVVDLSGGPGGYTAAVRAPGSRTAAVRAPGSRYPTATWVLHPAATVV